jgi:vancomycin resistance protein YoaR
LAQQANTDFSNLIDMPQNASLRFDEADQLVLVPSHPGEVIKTDDLIATLQAVVASSTMETNIPLSLQTSPPAIQDDETDVARAFAQQLLTDGLDFTYADQTYAMKAFTIKRLLEFTPQVDPNNFQNQILGLKMNPEGLAEYLTTTIVPAIDQPAQNARFVLSADGRVEQFALPQSGQQVDITATAANVAAKLAKHERVVPLSVIVAEPAVSEHADIKQLGITTKLATGESDFVGSPNNRKHNITIGAARYHGLLIAPGAEFSFNEFLGPVNAAAGFKPELVIKENVTTPEFGGGLCQVSTTLFRSALYAGLDITQRRNHSYAVSYYGQPGLDATIYPPYTDLRFLNNTPGYILIQSRIEGTKLAFDFWGTNDNRSVTVTGPVTYDRGTDGSVKAYVSQQVALANETIIDQTFYSRYKSPKLFPKVLAASSEAPAPQISPSPQPSVAPATPSPSIKPITPSPKPSNEPKPTSTPNEKPPTDG